ncbi:hypothetical protein BJ085DRAFT_13268, partial [Dimargaris cristalligena]
MEGRQCSHCHVTRTSQWRRDPNGGHFCNSCALEYLKHGTLRPVDPSCKDREIRRRNRAKGKKVDTSR